ncbi:hypothetical protein AZE42_13010 [Rhizopogon vesiculosus]|uniref:Uncharacterized protein n=1 Tax=Rhizopogon vesiculosus TaxID=180088 RepID=A0A1J8Q7D8_9AGAM|nr:hypothetical protein AZE42_13010 [Rhizopogon vesiculosus]
MDLCPHAAFIDIIREPGWKRVAMGSG